jgi:alkylation response protein AidB-like acyl-CoA dehydrogenase
MRVELTDEQEFLREAVAGVVSRDAPFTNVRAWTETGDLAAADALAQRQGWTGIGVDEDHGGQGGGTVELAVLAEQLGRGAVPWDRTLAGCLTAALVAGADGDEALALAAATAGGERVAVLAADGTRPLAPAGELRAGDRLTLRLRYVLGAADAHELVLALDAGDDLTLVAVAGDAPGVTIRRRTIVDRTRALADVEIDDTPVRRLGSVSRAALASTASAAAVVLAADALGAAGRLLDLTTQYVAERRQFGVPVGSFQAVKHAAAEMLVEVEGSRAAVHHGAWAVAAGVEDAALHAAIAKSHACSAAARVADKALFLHGAVGYTWEHDLQLPFKRTKSDALLLGSPDAYRDLIACELGLVPSATREPQTVA